LLIRGDSKLRETEERTSLVNSYVQGIHIREPRDIFGACK
jgi:hypothetical protein